MEHYSILKGNILSSHKKTWKTLKCMLLGERSQSERLYIPYDPKCLKFWKRQTVKRLVSARGLGSGGGGRGGMKYGTQVFRAV